MEEECYPTVFDANEEDDPFANSYLIRYSLILVIPKVFQLTFVIPPVFINLHKQFKENLFT